MFSSFLGSVVGITIFITAYLIWRNSKKLDTVDEKLTNLNDILTSLGNNVAELRRNNLSNLKPPEPPKAKTKKPEKPATFDKTVDDILVKTPKYAPPTPTPVIAAQATVQEKVTSPKIEKTVDNGAIVWGDKNKNNDNKSKATKTEPKPEVKDIWQKYSNLEFDLGAKLPVWLGSVALIISGFFFIKYSIENNLIPPYVRLIILFIIGVLMIFSAEFIRKKPKFANGRRISQALTGVGFAVIYGVLYASSQVWQYLPIPLATIAMITTTLSTLFMSVRFGVGIAYLALLTAYLTPLLMNVKESSTLFLFAYILGVFAAIAYVAKHQKWWNILLALLVGNFIWVIYWLTFTINTNNTIWVSLFLIAQSAVIVWSSRGLPSSSKITVPNFGNLINYIAHLGGLLFLAKIMYFADYSMSDLFIFNLVTLLSIGLSKYDEKNFIYMPFATAILGAFIFVTWQSATLFSFSIQMLISAILFAAFGFYQVTKSKNARVWAFLSTLTALVYFIIYYLGVNVNIIGFSAVGFNISDGTIALLAVSLSAIFAGAYIKLRNQTQITNLNNILANYAAISTALLSLAVAIYMSRTVWPLAFALQMLALSYIDYKLKNRTIRLLTIILATLIMLLLLPDLIDIAKYMLRLTFGTYLFDMPTWNTGVMNSPIIYLGIPTVCFAGAAFFMRMHLDDITVKIMETIALTLFTITGYMVIRYLFNGDAHLSNLNQSVFETSVTTSFIFLMGIVSFAMAKYTGREGYITRGWVNIGIAFGRIIIFDILFNNPLLEQIYLGGIVVFNPLIFIYALPIVWVFAIEYVVPEQKFTIAIKRLKILSALLLFAFINLNIRFAFQDYIVYWQDTSVAELYAYSLVWLLFGILLLVIAIWKQHKLMRFISQAIVMLAVSKVFLFDIANLEGLYRVASFAILGICLIGISAAYSRYILIENEPNDK